MCRQLVQITESKIIFISLMQTQSSTRIHEISFRKASKTILSKIWFLSLEWFLLKTRKSPLPCLFRAPYFESRRIQYNDRLHRVMTCSVQYIRRDTSASRVQPYHFVSSSDTFLTSIIASFLYQQVQLCLR